MKNHSTLGVAAANVSTSSLVLFKASTDFKKTRPLVQAVAPSTHRVQAFSISSSLHLSLTSALDLFSVWRLRMNFLASLCYKQLNCNVTFHDVSSVVRDSVELTPHAISYDIHLHIFLPCSLMPNKNIVKAVKVTAPTGNAKESSGESLRPEETIKRN